MSSSKQPTEKRLSPTKLYNRSYPRHKWLGALREEILNSDIKTWDFRIAIFFISLVIYGYVFSALTSWLPASVTGNFFFVILFELPLLYILGKFTIDILKRWAEADKEREREVLAERIQQDQYNGISERSNANSLFFDNNHPRKTYPRWIRKLYSYFFSTEEEFIHYLFTISFIIITIIIIGYLDTIIDYLVIHLQIIIQYIFNILIVTPLNIICILLITILIHWLREDWMREKAVMMKLKRREQEEKLSQRFAETQKQSFEIQYEAANELLAFEDKSPIQDDYRYPRWAWIRKPRDIVVRFSPKSRVNQFFFCTAIIFFVIFILNRPDLINPKISIEFFSLKGNLQFITLLVFIILSMIAGFIMEKIIFKLEMTSKRDMDLENKILESRTRKKESDVFKEREGQIPPPGFIKEHRYTDSIENLSLKGFAPSTISPDRSTKAIIDDDGSKILLKNAYTDKTLHIFSEHVGKVQCVAWSPDGNILASGADDGYILLWGTLTGNLLPFFIHHFDAVTSLNFSPDGQILISGSKDCTFKLWNPKNRGSNKDF